MDESVEDSILELAVLHLFAKDEATNQKVKVAPILAFFAVPVVFNRLVRADDSTGIYLLYVEIDDRRSIIREGHAALLALLPFFF
jgi:hypothetical protein